MLTFPNGVWGREICHGRGLWQGDPLSPMLFVLVMECLQVQALGRNIPHRTSLFADDVDLFLAPVDRDILVAREIMGLFEHATGLSTNYSKSQIFQLIAQNLRSSLSLSYYLATRRNSLAPTWEFRSLSQD